MKVTHRERALQIGDYSFEYDGINFELACSIERKANIDELYGNLMENEKGVNRLEKEFELASKISNEFILLIENCKSEEHLEGYVLPLKDIVNTKRVVREIGKPCFDRLSSWELNNRYRFKVKYVANKEQTAKRMLNIFYHYCRNFKKLKANRKIKD